MGRPRTPHVSAGERDAGGGTHGVVGASADGRRARRSFRDLNDPAIVNVQPARVQLVTLAEPMTGLVFTQRFPSSISAEQVYIINRIEATRHDEGAPAHASGGRIHWHAALRLGTRSPGTNRHGGRLFPRRATAAVEYVSHDVQR